MPQVPSSSKLPKGAPLGPSASVRLGPPTQQLLSGARWSGADAFPAWQVWADDVEEVLVFLQQEGRLAQFLAVTRKVATPHTGTAVSQRRARPLIWLETDFVLFSGTARRRYDKGRSARISWQWPPRYLRRGEAAWMAGRARSAPRPREADAFCRSAAAMLRPNKNGEIP